jgi:hypothetical protein
MIIDIEPGTFGGPLRNGDMIGVCNVIQHLRKSHNEIKFHMKTGTISQEDYCIKFFEFLKSNTDLFSDNPSGNSLPWRNVNIWDYRAISGDVVSIDNTCEMKKKIVIFPLFDAPYNNYRNWPTQVFYNIIEQYNSPNYSDYEKVICHSTPLNIAGYVDSSDFNENIKHIMESEIFVGGETGTTVFASSLDRPPKELIYYYSNRALLHTTPFHLLAGKGKMKNYWLDYERTVWG